MARHIEIDTEVILSAAREVLLEKGLKATAADVAKKANISDGTIFSRFKTKAELFNSAVFEVLSKDWFMAVDHFQNGDDFKDALVSSMVDSLKCLRIIMPIHMLAIGMCGGGESIFNLLSDRGLKPTPIRLHKRFEEFLNKLVDAGKIKACNTNALSGFLVGGLTHRVFLERSGALMNSNKINDIQLIQDIVQAVLGGIEIASRNKK